MKTERVLTALKNTNRQLRALGFRRSAHRASRPYPWEAAYPPGVSWDFKLRPRPVYALLDEAVSAYPDKACLSFAGKRYSYRAIGKLVGKLAHGLRKLGVGRGVRVGLLLPNTPYFVICYYAVLKAGGTVVNFNPLYSEREIARQIEDSGTSIMITLDLKSLYAKIASQLDRAPLKRVVVCRAHAALRFPYNCLSLWFRRREVAQIPKDDRHVMLRSLCKNSGEFEPEDIVPESDVAVLQYTGGVTGVSKGAMLTHANLYANALQIKTFARWVKPGGETCLVLVPLFHAFGMSVMNFAFSVGAELVLAPRFKVTAALQAVQRHRCTLLFGVPTVYSALSARSDARQYDLSSLRICVSGGGPLSPEVKAAFENVAGSTIIEGYGLTEASPVCTLVPFGAPYKRGSVGLPLPGTVIEIVSLTNPRRILPPGQAGEICVQGPQVMAGYWKQPAETQAVIQEGRLRTGDFGYIDDDGYLFLLDRIKDVIISGGFNIYPRVVEEAIGLHPAVAQTMVCGRADRHRGERVKAYVRLRPGFKLTAAELRAFLKDKLAPFEVPDEIEFLAQFPPELLERQSRKKILIQEFRKKRRARFWKSVGEYVRGCVGPLRGWRLAFRATAPRASES
ncbi:MAG TPA: long-chain fatty acid--CoA ligase [Candidatus Acidoferrales bacterium]|nr:long-chain fatty acid--CoA ligase [Candidatus Acidoferrales bacterium]